MLLANTESLLILTLSLELAGLTLAVGSDAYLRREHRRVLLLIIALSACLLAQNIADYRLDLAGTRHFERTLVSIFGYAVRPTILVLFLYVVSERRLLPEWLAVALNAGIYLTACFSRICFWIDEGGHFQRGPLAYTCFGVSAFLLAELVVCSIRACALERKREIWIPLFNALLIIASVALDSFIIRMQLPVTYLTIAVVNCNIFCYVWLHMQFVRRHEMSLMAEQRIRIMMTQIQPHFLYNTLSTIQVLCLKEPKKAAEITGKFGAYLRQNLNTLEFSGLIPVERELEHTRTYADIESIRFPNIRVEYEIEDSGFLIPPLSVQPIVENAIRHGVRIREQGLVRVTTHTDGSGHAITISDNGVGFDAETLERSGTAHIGIRNVRERIEKMCGGTLTVESRIGEGTTVTIRIPDQGRIAIA